MTTNNDYMKRPELLEARRKLIKATFPTTRYFFNTLLGISAGIAPVFIIPMIRNYTRSHIHALPPSDQFHIPHGVIPPEVPYEEPIFNEKPIFSGGR